MLRVVLISVVLFAAGGIRSAAAQGCRALPIAVRGKAPARGRVIDAGTGHPLPMVVVVVDRYSLGATDCEGNYTILLFADGEHTMTVDLPGYVSARQVATFTTGKTVVVNFALQPAPPACCSLAGTWTIELTMDSAAAIGPRPAGRHTAGSIVFNDSIPSPFGRPPAANTAIRGIAGRFHIDLVPFFGGPVARDVSSSTFGDTGGDFLVEAEGAVFSNDSVSIDLIPRISHGGLSLAGRLQADSVAGEWYQRAYCCGATGHFVMRRKP